MAQDLIVKIFFFFFLGVILYAVGFRIIRNRKKREDKYCYTKVHGEKSVIDAESLEEYASLTLMEPEERRQYVEEHREIHAKIFLDEDLSRALVGLLSAYASVDGEFHAKEYQKIFEELGSSFEVSQSDMEDLKAFALETDHDKYKIEGYIAKLKTELNENEKERLLNLLDEIAKADEELKDIEKSFANYIRKRLNA